MTSKTIQNRKWIAGLFAGVWLCVSGAFGADSEAQRTWRDESGKFEVVGRLSKVEGDHVQLQKADGQFVRVPVSRLSLADREYLKSVDRPNPVVAGEKASVNSAKDALVLLSRKSKDQWFSQVGVVYRHDQDRGYILVSNMGLNSRPTAEQLKEPDTPPGEWKLTWGAGEQRREAMAKEFARTPDETKAIYVAPVKDLPPPITVGSMDGVQPQADVEVVGYRISRPEPNKLITLPAFLQQEPQPSLVPVQIAGTISRLNRHGDTLRFFTVEADAAGDVNLGLVVDSAGSVLGVSSVGQLLDLYDRMGFGANTLPEAERKNPKRFLKAIPGSVLPDWEKPRAHWLGVRAVSGDFENVKLEVVFQLEDAFQRVDQLKLFMKVAPKGGVNQPKDDPRDGSLEVKLTQRDPSPGVAKQFVGLPTFGPNWVGELTIPNPLNSTVLFHGALDYKPKVGETVEIQQVSLEFKFSQEVPAGTRPDIPGADGRPLVLSAFTKHPRGGTQVTSALTKAKDSPKPVEQGKFPEPATTGIKVLGEVVKVGDFETRSMPYQPAKNSGELALFSPDGKWFYLVDLDNVLRRISTEDWTESAKLTLRETPNALSLSAAGLVVSFFTSNRAWVIDSKTLTVRRELPCEKPWILAANPANSLGVIMHNTDPTPRGIKYYQLSLVDFESGNRLHEIRFSYLDVEGHRQFDSEPRLLKFTPDGRHLFSVQSRVTRFRLESGELIYEQASDELAQDTHDRADLSPNGKQITMYGTPQGIPRTAKPILNAQELDKSVRTLTPEGNHAVGVVGLGVEKSFACGLKGDLFVFGPDGKQLHQAPFPSYEFLHRIVVDPAADRFVTWNFGKPITVWTYPGTSK